MKEYCLLGYSAVYCTESQPMFRRNISSEKIVLFVTTAVRTFCWNFWEHLPEHKASQDSNLHSLPYTQDLFIDRCPQPDESNLHLHIPPEPLECQALLCNCLLTTPALLGNKCSCIENPIIITSNGLQTAGECNTWKLDIDISHFMPYITEMLQ